MDAVVWGSVVSITDDRSGFGVDCVWPLPVIGGDGDDEIIQITQRATIAKAAGIAAFQQFCKRIVGKIAGVTTFINSTCRQVDTFQLCKGYGSHLTIQFRYSDLFQPNI